MSRARIPIVPRSLITKHEDRTGQDIIKVLQAIIQNMLIHLSAMLIERITCRGIWNDTYG